MKCRTRIVCLHLALFGLLFSASAMAKEYKRYFVGDASVPTPGQVSPGLLLMGGGDRNYDALRWFLAKSGNGHVVVLRASQSTDVADELFHDVGGVASVETFVFSGRESSADPALLASLAKADGIFIAGGDQSRYVRFWKGTPVAAALDAHVKAGKPIGGTSAGLAILGEYLYGAMDGGSIVSPEALADPLGPATTIEHDFLHIDLLKGVVTDTHFTERERLGRLFAFVAKAEAIQARPDVPLLGVGVDESASLAVEADGSARVFATDPRGGAVLVKGGFTDKQAAGKPLSLDRVKVVGVGTGSKLSLPDGAVTDPSFERFYRVVDGKMTEVLQPVLVIHGGAGVVRSEMTPAIEAAARAGLTLALQKGHEQLMAGKPAMDAVLAAITVLEDDPTFNAGKGAVFTHDGRHELDAAVMDGATRRAGSVAGLQHVRNPVLLARAVMEKSKHVMMVGAGAEAFAREQGLALVDPTYFHTERRWQQLQKALKEEAGGQAHTDLETAKYFGTVGALALDRMGHLAAGTSTGGMTNKRYGRVGDAPIIGAGTYADAGCAVSGTGWGEFYLRAVAAHAICARMAYLTETPQQAGQAVITQVIPKLGGDGGAIVLGADGAIAMPFNVEGMYRGWIGADGVAHVAIYSDEMLPSVPEPSEKAPAAGSASKH